MAKALFQLEPLSCPSCIKKIESTLSKQSGVKEAKVLFHSSKVKAEFDASVVEGESLKNVIEQLGYAVKSVKMS